MNMSTKNKLISKMKMKGRKGGRERGREIVIICKLLRIIIKFISVTYLFLM